MTGNTEELNKNYVKWYLLQQIPFIQGILSTIAYWSQLVELNWIIYTDIVHSETVILLK